MRQQIPLAVVVIIVAVAVVLGAVLIWQFAGRKPAGTFEEFRQQQGQPSGGLPGGMMPAPRPPQQRGQPSAGGGVPSPPKGQ